MGLYQTRTEHRTEPYNVLKCLEVWESRDGVWGWGGGPLWWQKSVPKDVLISITCEYVMLYSKREVRLIIS